MALNPQQDQANRKWYQKLKNKYRLVIMNDETYEERFSFRLSRLNVFISTGTLGIILISLTILIIAFTPLREYIPGYMDPTLPKRLYKLEQRTDSLYQTSNQKDLYIQTIKNIIEGKDFNDTLVEDVDVSINYDTIQLRTTLEDSLFKAAYELQNRYNLNIYESTEEHQNFSSANLNFFTPLKGTITRNFDLIDKHYGVDVITGSNETIKATLDGTVIFSDWSTETGFVIGIQHHNNFVSIYKHNSALLKKIGNNVRAGEPIAIVGETGELSTGPHLHFELWYNGAPVNPKDYITF
jgi:murein DD-endopeptidase MepM/ murein hydrolase activator NlpD